MDYFGSKSHKLPSAGSSAPRPRLDLMTRECLRLYSPIKDFWLMTVLGYLEQNETLYFLPPTLCPKKRSRATDGTNSRCYAIVFHFSVSERRVP